MTWNIHHADVIKWAEIYTGPKFHALFCDPPYHLTSIVKRFGGKKATPAKYGSDGAFARASAGFMGQKWDGGDIAFRPETWAALGQHLYPGAFGMAFASSRGWHRLACAIEDAGLVIHPSIFGWLTLSGFPKATRIDTQLDRAAGAEREVVGQADVGPDIRGGNYKQDSGGRRVADITAPATPEALAWAGHRYGLQALKPSLEPIIVFQKPYDGRPVDNISQTGAGALNIAGSRIPLNGDYKCAANGRPSLTGLGDNYNPETANQPSDEGRWPANFILSHHPECNGRCVPGCPVASLDAQSGNRPAGSSLTGSEPSETNVNAYAGTWNRQGFDSYDDGGASRMFHQTHWHYELFEQLAAADPVTYAPKVSRLERNAGLDHLPTKTRHRVNAGGLENEKRFAPTRVKNNHPTLKPISLTKYLATLLLPPPTISDRRILVPFAGSGSEMIGCLLAGWDKVVGVEKTDQYLTIALDRVAWWADWISWGQTDIESILASVKSAPEPDRAIQLEMFN